MKHEGEYHGLHSMMWGVTGLVIAMVLVTYYLYHMRDKKPPRDEQIVGIKKVWYDKYYVDEIYNTLITKPLDSISSFLSAVFDTKVLDSVVNSVGLATRWLSSTLRTIQTGSVGFYFFAMVLSIVFFLIYKLL
jgi:NADH-quinone oxidoreductase subunit L